VTRVRDAVAFERKAAEEALSRAEDLDDAACALRLDTSALRASARRLRHALEALGHSWIGSE